jgi:hypothetical protein
MSINSRLNKVRNKRGMGAVVFILHRGSAKPTQKINGQSHTSCITKDVEHLFIILLGKKFADFYVRIILYVS